MISKNLAPEIEDASAERMSPGSAPSRRPLVLVADDDVVLLDMLSQSLGSAYEVVTATDGRLALNLALERNPDLVLADVMMPEIDGFGLLDALRAEPKTKTLPVILLTGRIDESSRMKGLKGGADDYLVKPFNSQELLMRIESRLEMSRIRRQAELRERQLRYEAEAAQQRMRFLADAAVVLSSSLDFKATLAQVVALAVPRIGDWCAVDLLSDDGSLQRVAAQHVDPQKTETARDLVRRFPPRATDPFGTANVMSTGRSELRSEIAQEDLSALSQDRDHLASLLQLGLKSEIVVPLIARDRAFGAITFAYADSGRHFTRRDLALAEGIAQRAALAIDNAKLYFAAQRSMEDLEARVEKRTRELASANAELNAEVQERKQREAEVAARTRQQAAVTELGQLALENGSLSDLFNEAATLVARTLEVDLCRVLQLSADASGTRLAAGVGWKKGMIDLEKGKIDPNSPAGFALQSAMPVVVDDLASDLRFSNSKLLRENGAVSGVIVPIGGPSAPLGILAAYSSTRRKFTKDDVNFLQSVAHLMGAMVARKDVERSLLKLSLRLMTAEDAERRRIAKELHDSTAQDLVAVMMNLESLCESAAESNPAVAKQIEDSLALLENCAHEIRTLSYVLHPPRLEEAGLAGAIRHYVVGFGERTDLVTNVDLSADLVRLGEAVEIILFRVVQESLSNIHRHSQSETASVRLSHDAAGIILEIQDKGRGIPRQILEARAGQSPGLGVGIPGMRERLRQIGGRLEIDSGADGTIIRAAVPWMSTS